MAFADIDMMRGRPAICHLLHGLRVGGAEVLAARLARRLSDRFRFVFVCLDELGTLGEQLREEAFPVHVLDRRPGLDWRCMASLRGLFRRERVDIIHAHQYTPFFYAMAARLGGRRPRVVFTEHGRHHPDYPRRKRIWFNRLVLTGKDRVVGVGEAVRRALVVNEGLPAQRVAVVYNGIDTEAFHPRSYEREGIRTELGLQCDDFAILQVARLDYLKDHATAIRTLARLVPQCPRARLLLVGEGPELPKIEQLIGEHGLEANVRLLGLRTDVPRLLQSADAFLLSSISEGIPVTLIEAMAAGLPVVCTAVGGVAEVVQDGETGLLGPAGADADLAEHLLCLANSPELRRRLGQAGCRRAAEKFGEVQMHAGYCRIYEELLGDRQPARLCG